MQVVPLKVAFFFQKLLRRRCPFGRVGKLRNSFDSAEPNSGSGEAFGS